MQFSRGGEPDGGKISNFLLEKVCLQLLKILIKGDHSWQRIRMFELKYMDLGKKT